jgi:hypothetical protein
MPLGTNHGIECRTGPTQGSHTLIAVFQNTLTNGGTVTASATTNSGSQAVTVSSAVGADTHQLAINLSGVPNASNVTVTLHGVTDSAGNTGDIVIPADFLLGDANATRRTDSGDVTVVRNQTVSTPAQSNFRLDVNCSGRIDAGDVTVTRSNSVTALP